ncbi:MAG: ATPase [Hyphomicrobiales bacterium]|nr:ATPase [Hyphomicrobiales bacterium]
MSEADAASGRMAQLPKRFYDRVDICETGEGWGVRLDDKEVLTPARARLEVPNRLLARAIGDEWEAQTTRIDPDTMPLTRLANTTLDGVRGKEGEVAGDIASYAGSDLVCYRADTPEGLVAMQCEHWDPVLAWAGETLEARFVSVAGIMHRDQPADALSAVRAALDHYDAFALAALHTITTLTGSALLALAHATGRLSAEEAWAAAHVDEDWQISQWGEDEEAAKRHAVRWREMAAAAQVLGTLAAGQQR